MQIAKIVKWINKNVLLGAKPQWKWCGDESSSVLFERKTTYAEFIVVETVGVERGADRGCCFSDVWEPGSISIPERLQAKLGEDKQWYVPKDVEIRAALLSPDGKKVPVTSKRILQQMTADVEVVVGERVPYWVSVSIEYDGECLATETAHDQDVHVDFYDMEEVEEITSQVLPGLVKAARMHWFYKTRTLAAA
jgi:hypothetical protein